MSIGSETARPHSQELTTNISTEATNSFTAPKRCVSQPVSGSAIALATANDVMTHVACELETPRSPAIDDSDTFAIDVSSTFMNVASASEIVPIAFAEPASGGKLACGCGFAGAGGTGRSSS